MTAVGRGAAETQGSDPAIARIKRRYYLLMASVAGVDMTLTAIYVLTSDGAGTLLRNFAGATAMLVVANLLIARRIFGPIARFLDGQAEFASAERRLTQLPLYSAAAVAAITIPLWAFRMGFPVLFPDQVAPLPIPTPLDATAVAVAIMCFYFTYIYFLISDYLSSLGQFMFDRWQINLGLFFGQFSLKLGVALLVTSILPMILVLIDLFSYDGARVREEILTDVVSSLFGIALSAVFVARSLNRPLAILNRGIAKVADGDLNVKLPVTSNDEVGMVTGEFNRMVSGLQEREFIRETFGKYVSESVAHQVLKDRGRLAGEVRTATLMFVDIQGFTTLAERLSPQQTIALLDEYTGLVIAAVTAHGGVINNFIGDGVFASFNLPLDNPAHARSAVLAAIDLCRALDTHRFANGTTIAIRIGINTGVVVAGTVGAGDRLTYSILGDAVNLAHRVEEMNKELGTRILLTDSTWREAGTDLPVTPVGERTVRGRQESVRIYKVDVGSANT